MRYDINILWIEDAEDWQKGAQELFLERCEDGLLIKIDYIKKNIEMLFDKIQTEASGYKNYDIMFIDYNIGEEDSGNKITGDKIIEEFRKNNIDTDILFYSDKLSEEEEREKIKTANGDFDGIYLAKRNDFQEKALKLYKKNARKLTSILNIRGFLADKTSENDFIMHSYLLEKFDSLAEDKKEKISILIKSMLIDKLEIVLSKTKSEIKILKGEPYIFKDIYDLPDFLFSIKDKYNIFFEILNTIGNNPFTSGQVDEYKKIIDRRNTVAHKKIDVCKQQKYLKYYDTIRQYRGRVCPVDCKDHDNSNKISLADWKDLLKKTNEISIKFDMVFKSLSQEKE